MTVDRTPHVRRAGFVITFASLAGIAFATLLPDYGHVSLPNLCVFCGALGGVNALLNVFLFAPLGVGLSLSGVPRKRAILTAFLLSVLIEFTQLYLIPGRDAAIGDVLTNTLGGALGFLITGDAGRWVRPPAAFAKRLSFGWAVFWLAIQVISSFGLAISLPSAPYYGQIAGDFWNFAVFPGRVLAASVGDVVIRNRRLRDDSAVRTLLLAGATAEALVVPAEPTNDVAPILRVVDGKKDEIVLLAQNGDYLVFTTRTGASVLRLRPLMFGLPHAFPAPTSSRIAGPDTLRLSGRHTSRDVQMTASGSSASESGSVPLTASLGWALWLPFQWLVEGSRAEMIIGSIWLIALSIPLGYWSIDTYSLRSHGRIMLPPLNVVVGFASLLFVGLVAVPVGFGVPAASLCDWLSTVAGTLIGSFLGVTSRRVERATATLPAKAK